MVINNIIKGNILDQNNHNFICHQCNCVTSMSKGLSEQIFKKYPKTNIYAKRNKPSTPGTIEINYDDNVTIIHMFGQVFPGKSGSYERFYRHVLLKDKPSDRVEYFKECLQQLDNLNLSVPVAIPYGIGCGLAGGDWTTYEKLLQECKTNIVLYKI